MIDPDAIRSTLYTRQQVGRLTGLDDSTLNYWMREGVLRPSEGGAGKGQHRRFPFHQVNLALLLDQLRSFGVSLPALKRLSTRFHDALECFDALGITREIDEPLSTIVHLRSKFEKKGFLEESVPEDKVDRYLELFPWFEGRDLTRKYRHMAFTFKASFEESVQIVQKAYLAYDREPDEFERYPSEIVELANRLDMDEYSIASRYWSPITYIEENSNTDIYSYTPHIFYRTSDGEWDIVPGDPPSSLDSYVGINLDRLSFEAWSKP